MLERTERVWRIRGGNLALDLDRETGGIVRLETSKSRKEVWFEEPAALQIRDDRVRKTFDRRDVADVRFTRRGERLTVQRTFRGAPWVLKEPYQTEKGAVRWDAELVLERGLFRSCAITLRTPLPAPIFPLTVWSARDQMPTHVHSHHELVMEYAEVNGGIILPTVAVYVPAGAGSYWGRTKADNGLLMSMPFDFKTPRLSFVTSYREEYLAARFDWLALSRTQRARASLLLRGIGGDWRPGLGWLYERYPEYFEPRSRRIHKLWGGHFTTCDPWIALKEAKTAASLGARWCELHEHFAGYGDYAPEHEPWVNGDATGNPPITSQDVRNYIATIQEAGVAALPYLQVSGDGHVDSVAKQFEESQIRDLRGEPLISWPKTVVMNSDLALPFGQHIRRMIDEFMRRYSKLDGVFLDQPSYNFQDTRHDDGISAYENRSCYMVGFNYEPHLEHLSQLLHPEKAIIANGPISIALMKYIDGIMDEGIWHGCERYQYYALAKPMFFLHPTPDDRHVEMMLQYCLLYACGMSCHAELKPFAALFRAYRPLIEKLNRRRWVFDPAPFQLPDGFKGGLYRSEGGNVMLTVMSQMARLSGRRCPDFETVVCTRDIDDVRRVTVQLPGGKAERASFSRENDGIHLKLPGRCTAALVELHSVASAGDRDGTMPR